MLWGKVCLLIADHYVFQHSMSSVLGCEWNLSLKTKENYSC